MTRNGNNNYYSCVPVNSHIEFYVAIMGPPTTEANT